MECICILEGTYEDGLLLETGYLGVLWILWIKLACTYKLLRGLDVVRCPSRPIRRRLPSSTRSNCAKCPPAVAPAASWTPTSWARSRGTWDASASASSPPRAMRTHSTSFSGLESFFRAASRRKAARLSAQRPREALPVVGGRIDDAVVGHLAVVEERRMDERTAPGGHGGDDGNEGVGMF